jgi:biotin carboxyl carrier protein
MKLRITVEGKSYEVDVEVLDDRVGSPAPMPQIPVAAPPVSEPRSQPTAASAPSAASGGKAVKAPIVGTIMQVKVAPGDILAVNQVVLVMEAMKMETDVASPFAGKVKSVYVAAGEAVKAGQVLVELE